MHAFSTTARGPRRRSKSSVAPSHDVETPSLVPAGESGSQGVPRESLKETGNAGSVLLSMRRGGSRRSREHDGPGEHMADGSQLLPTASSAGTSRGVSGKFTTRGTRSRSGRMNSSFRNMSGWSMYAAGPTGSGSSRSRAMQRRFGTIQREKEPFIAGAVGTPLFMAPELHDHQGQVASDYWSMGVTLFWLIAGRLPFLGYSGDSLRRAGRYGHVSWRLLPANCSPECADLLRGLLEPKPHLRYDAKILASHPFLMPEAGNKRSELTQKLELFASPARSGWRRRTATAATTTRAGSADTGTAVHGSEAEAGASSSSPGTGSDTGRDRGRDRGRDSTSHGQNRTGTGTVDPVSGGHRGAPLTAPSLPKQLHRKEAEKRVIRRWILDDPFVDPLGTAEHVSVFQRSAQSSKSRVTSATATPRGVVSVEVDGQV